MTEVVERELPIRGLRIRVREAGRGPLVLLLHGFPETSLQWSPQITTIASGGYRVVAPDQRGYARSSKPPRVRDYRVEELAADVDALAAAYDQDTATIVGHDWGGIVAYYTAMLFPERVSRLVILNAPHPAHFEAMLRSRLSQLRRSWYAFFFLVPKLPELITKANGWAGLKRAFSHAEPGSMPDELLRGYVEAWSQPGASRAMINWYRAEALRTHSKRRRSWRPIEKPTLVLWGDRDRYLLPELAHPPREWVPFSETIHFDEAGHWVHHECSARVSSEIMAFLERT